jgi:hypothetical protein
LPILAAFLVLASICLLDCTFSSHSLDDFTHETRAQIWRNFLKKATSLSAVDEKFNVAELAEHDLNGRQIRNVIKLAQSLGTVTLFHFSFARVSFFLLFSDSLGVSENHPELEMKYLEAALKVVNQFKKEVLDQSTDRT